MHNRLPPKVMCSALCALFTFWEITDIVSKMVHDRDIVALENEIGNSIGILNGTNTSDLE